MISLDDFFASMIMAYEISKLKSLSDRIQVI